MFKLKNFTRKFRSLKSDDDDEPSPLNIRRTFDDKQVRLLTEWLDRLNKERLVIITDQDDIVIQAGGKSDPNQQIFVNYHHIHRYMERKESTDQTQTIAMMDLARILLEFDYVYESSGQLSFSAHTIATDNNQFKWLKSIIHHAQPNRTLSQTDVKLSDGENTQTLAIPSEYLTPTDDTQIIARYLLQNGHIRYDVDHRTFAYRFIPPDPLLDDRRDSSERISQRQLLSFHVRDILIDPKKKSIRLQFRNRMNEELSLPTAWYEQIANHRFDRDYILDILLANGGVINRNRLTFMGRSFVLDESQTNFSWKEKMDLIRRYIHLIIEMDAVKKDQTKQLILLQNDADGKKLYFTPEHSSLIEKNQFRREDVIHILLKHAQIRQDQYDRWFLIYNNQSIRLPSSVLPTRRISSGIEQYRPRFDEVFPSKDIEKDSIQGFDHIIDYMCRHGLVTWDKSSNVIRLQFADQNLLLPIDHLRSVVDPRLASPTNAHLPFTSRQLSEWLRKNSYITRQKSIQ